MVAQTLRLSRVTALFTLLSFFSFEVRSSEANPIQRVKANFQAARLDRELGRLGVPRNAGSQLAASRLSLRKSVKLRRQANRRLAYGAAGIYITAAFALPSIVLASGAISGVVPPLVPIVGGGIATGSGVLTTLSIKSGFNRSATNQMRDQAVEGILDQAIVQRANGDTRLGQMLLSPKYSALLKQTGLTQKASWLNAPQDVLMQALTANAPPAAP